jgi:hypothetical protein
MQFLAVSALYLLLISSQGVAASEHSADSALVDALANEGRLYQLAKDCGASEEILARFEAQNLEDIAEMKQDSAGPGSDFDKAYADGKALGAKQFSDLGAGAKGSQACVAAIATVETL